MSLPFFPAAISATASTAPDSTAARSASASTRALAPSASGAKVFRFRAQARAHGLGERGRPDDGHARQARLAARRGLATPAPRAARRAGRRRAGRGSMTTSVRRSPRSVSRSSLPATMATSREPRRLLARQARDGQRKNASSSRLLAPPARARRSAGLPSARRRPRWQKADAIAEQLGLGEVVRREDDGLPRSARRRARSSRRKREASTSRPTVGSSSTSTAGSWSTARATESRCRWPTESASQRRSRSGSRSRTPASSAVRSAIVAGAAHAMQAAEVA